MFLNSYNYEQIRMDIEHFLDFREHPVLHFFFFRKDHVILD